MNDRVNAARRTADETALIQALKHCEQAMIQAFVQDVEAMSLALCQATQSGGRRAFETEKFQWKDRRTYEEFMLRLDHWLTRMPPPRPDTSA